MEIGPNTNMWEDWGLYSTITSLETPLVPLTNYLKAYPD